MKELERLDSTLPQLEKQRCALEAQISNHCDDMTARSLELAELISTIEEAEERWLELSELAS